MKRTDLGDCKTIDAFVQKKLEKLKATDKTLRSMGELMFAERENVMLEWTNGYRITRMTYGECYDRICRASAAVAEELRDVPENAIVGLYMQNSVEWIVLFWALLKCGYRPLLMNTRLEGDRLDGVVADHGVAAVLSDGRGFSVPTFDGKELAARKTDAPAPDRWANELIVMSSGTSEQVKLCVYNGEKFFYQISDSARIIRTCAPMKKHYENCLKQLAFLPFYHIFGLAAMYIWFAFFARTFVLLNDLNPNTILNTVRKHKVTHIFAVPLFWNTVYAAAEKKIRARGEKTWNKLQKGLKTAEKLGNVPFLGRAFSHFAFKEVRRNLFGDSICFLISGGSAISREVLSFFNGIGYHIANGYGMTEIGITSLELSYRPAVRNSASVGKPFESVEYRIENGELQVRGKSLASAILRADGREERAGEDWFPTGDLAEEKNGRYYILGRRDDMVVCKNGENLNPDWVEGHLNVEGVTALCLTARTDAGGESVPVLVAGVSRYLAPARMQAVRDECRSQLSALGLGSSVTEVILTPESLMGENDFKTNRRRVREKLAAGILQQITPEQAERAGKNLNGELCMKLRALFAQALRREESEISDDAHFFFDLGGSSLDYFALLSAIREEFGAEMPTDAGQNSLATVSAFCEYLQNNL